jgi:hypothetical protein
MADVTVQLEALDTPFFVTVEPWACPVFEVKARQRCRIVVHYPVISATVTCAVAVGELFVTVHEAGSTFSFVREEVIEFTLPERLALPSFSAARPGGK